MSTHYPKTRVYAKHGALLMREGLSICFYMRKDPAELAHAVARSLDTYVREVGPQALGWYVDEEGDWQQLDTESWARFRNELPNPAGCLIRLYERPDAVSDHAFTYYGRKLTKDPNETCVARFWLPTEYLEAHGPEGLRKLALELATPLPFNSGHAGLSFKSLTKPKELRELSFRHPGMDYSEPGSLSMNLGTRVRGAYWMTLLGQPVLGELGGATGLRARLTSPGISVQEMEGDRVAITLGTWPEAGDTEAGQDLPLYRELARVLEPWFFHPSPSFNLDFHAEDVRRWERRFLD